MEIVSTMGSGSLGKEIDLDTLATELKNQVGESLEVSFQSDGIVTVKFGEESPAFSIYRTGSFQIRGPGGHSEMKDAVNELLQILSDIGFESGDIEFEEKTSVFLDELDQGVNLEMLTVQLGLEHTEYEPEQFPGLVYRSPDVSATLLIFASGKVLIVGTTEERVAKTAFQSISKFVGNTSQDNQRE